MIETASAADDFAGSQPHPRNHAPGSTFRPRTVRPAGHREEADVGKGILLWLLGIPLPIIIILLLIWH